MDQNRWLAGGRYELLDALGRGGTATVYRAVDHKLGRAERAVKVLENVLRSRQDMRERLLFEARVLAGLRHPNVVTVYDYGTEDDVTYVVMDLLDGQSLRQRVKWEGPMDAATAVRTLLPILGALEAVHAIGVVHRDIKPSNILLSDGNPVLIDFGIARGPESLEVTLPGLALGTLAYMPPEQRQDARLVGPAADIFAVGATLYWLVTKSSPMDLAFAPADAERWFEVPRGLRGPIQRAVARDPAHRYPSAAAMIEALQAFLDGDITATPRRGPERRASLRQVRAAYLEGLRHTVTEVAAAREADDQAALRRLGHNLRGSGGTFGFPAITEAGAAVEEAEATALGEATEALLVVLGAVLEEESAASLVLIVEDDPAMQAFLIHEVQGPTLDVAVVADGSSALTFVSGQPPSLILLNLGLPDTDGLGLLTALHAMCPDTPIVVVAAPRTPAVGAQCLERGASHFLAKPIGAGAVRATLDRLLRPPPDNPTGPRILAVEDDPGMALMLERLFTRVGLAIRVVHTGQELLAQRELPDLFLVDAGLPDTDGFTVVQELRRRPTTRAIPVIFLTGRSGVDDVVRGFDVGADDYVTKPFAPAELLARVRRLLRTRPPRR